jgi:hypothetical protein
LILNNYVDGNKFQPTGSDLSSNIAYISQAARKQREILIDVALPPCLFKEILKDVVGKL